MKRALWLSIGGIGAAMFVAAVQAQVPPEPLKGVSPDPIEGSGIGTADELEKFIDSLVGPQLLGSTRVAGVVVAIVKDRKPFLVKGYGCADASTGRPVMPTTVFRVGSVSKLVAWTALMQQVDRGGVKLDSPITPLIGFPLPSSAGNPITLRNLFTHTAGFEENSLGFVVKESKDDLVPLDETLQRHIPAQVRPATVDFRRAQDSSYSNWAAGLGGHIVARLNGGDFDRYVDDEIFRALGMERSSYAEPLPPALDAERAEGHQFRNWADRGAGAHGPGPCGATAKGRFVPQPFQYFHSLGPPASLSTSGSDMAKFMAAHLDGGRGLFRDPASADLMRRRALGATAAGNGAALGFWEVHHNGRRILVHEGFTRDFMALLALIPEERAGFFIAVNSPPPVPLAYVLRDFVGHYFKAVLPDVTPLPGFEDRAAAFVGTYRLNLHSHSRLDKALALVHPDKFEVDVSSTGNHTLRFANDQGEILEWEEAPGQRDLFRQTKTLLSGAQAGGQELAAFVRDDAGMVTHLLRTIAFQPAYRLEGWETARFHRLLLGIVLLLYSITAGWPLAKGVGVPGDAACIRRLGAVISLCSLAGFGIVWESLAAYWGPLVAISLLFRVALLLLLVAAGLTIGFAVCLLRGKVRGQERVLAIVFLIASIAFFWSLNFWNLLGFKLA